MGLKAKGKIAWEPDYDPSSGGCCCASPLAASSAKRSSAERPYAERHSQEDAQLNTSNRDPALNLEQAVSKALLSIPSELDKLLTHHFGLGSGIPSSTEEQAQEEGCSVDELKRRKADALRMLMGYRKPAS